MKHIKHKISLRTNNTHVIRFIDLFCGIGGFRQAIENFNKKQTKYQFKCLLSVDIKKDALKIYNINFKENWSPTDIRKIKYIENFDLLCAGFPCQPFSLSGSRKGLTDKRGNLIYNIIEICSKYKPTIIILENVPNLVSINKGQILKIIMEEFTKIGYKITHKILDSKNFGIPQNRKRLFIIGSLNNYINLDYLKTHPPQFLKNIIEYDKKYTNIPLPLFDKLIQLNNTKNIEGCSFKDKRGGEMNINSWDLELNGTLNIEQKNLMKKIMTERRKKHWAEKKKIQWTDGMPLTFSEIQTFYNVDHLDDLLNDLVAKKYLRIEKPKDLINDHRIYKKDAEEGYNICKGQLSFPISRILDKNKIAPTLTATDSCKLVIYFENYIRYLTKDEFKKICGFPHDFIITDDVNYFDLFGNMVCPPVVESILDVIYY